MRFYSEFGGAYGGEGEIRTHGTREGTTVFETVPIDHSGTSPREARYSIRNTKGKLAGRDPRERSRDVKMRIRGGLAGRRGYRWPAYCRFRQSAGQTAEGVGRPVEPSKAAPGRVGADASDSRSGLPPLSWRFALRRYRALRAPAEGGAMRCGSSGCRGRAQALEQRRRPLSSDGRG